MQISFRGQSHVIPLGRIVGMLLVTAVVVGIGSFVYRVYENYQTIRAGNANPLWQQQLQSTISHAAANPDVTAQDIARVANATSPQLGNPNASLKIVEFLDFDCPYCEESYGPVRELMEQYKDKVLLTVRNFPLEDVHPRALPSALAAECAKEQGKFWVYHDKLYADQDHHEDADFSRLIQEVGGDQRAFDQCYQAARYQSVIDKDIADGLRAGVEGTPTFFFNGIRIQGAFDKATLEAVMKQFLTATSTSSTR